MSDNLFGMPQPVNCCRIDPINAELYGMPHRLFRCLVVLWSPPVSPAASANRPGSKTGRRDLKSARTKRTLIDLHDFLLDDYCSWLLSDISPSATASATPSVLLEITARQLAPMPDFICGAAVVVLG